MGRKKQSEVSKQQAAKTREYLTYCKARNRERKRIDVIGVTDPKRAEAMIIHLDKCFMMFKKEVEAHEINGSSGEGWVMLRRNFYRPNFTSRLKGRR